MNSKCAWGRLSGFRRNPARSLIAAALALALAGATLAEQATSPSDAAPGVPVLRLFPEPPSEPVPYASAGATPPTVPEEAPDPRDVAKISGIQRSMAGEAPPINGDSDVFSPVDDSNGGGGQMFIQSLMALCIVLALILLAYAALRKWGRRNPLIGGGEHAACIGRLYLDRNSRVHLVRVGGRVLVVGTAGSSVTLLADMDGAAFSGEAAPPRPAEEAVPPADSFYDQLQANLSRMEQSEHDDAEIEEIRTEIVRLKRVLDEEPDEHAQ